MPIFGFKGDISKDKSTQLNNHFYNLDDSISTPEAIVRVKNDKVRHASDGTAGTSLLKGIAPKDYMPLAREGKTTADRIGQERLQTITNYIIEDLGGNFNYNLASFRDKEKRKNFSNLDSLRREFDNQYFEETGRTGKVMYPVTPVPLNSTNFD